MSEIIDFYHGGGSGWAGPVEAQIAWESLKRQGCYFENITQYIGDNGQSKMMLYEITRKLLGKDTDNYAQEIGDCYQAGTKISMSDGSEKNVEDIREGEMVLNHINEPRKVIGLVKKNYTGRMVKIKLKGWHRELIATETHDALYMPKKNSRFKFTEFSKKKFKDYKIGDYLLLPYGINSIEYQYLNFNGKKIKVDENFARFIGLYLAEGGLSTNPDTGISYKTTFSLCTDEEIFADEILALSEQIFGVSGVKYYHKKEQNVLIVDIHNTELASFIKSIISGNVYSKYIPLEFFNSPKTVKISLIRGWLDGDGHYNCKNNKITGVTSSRVLQNDISRLSLSCGINNNSLIRKKEKHQNVAAGQIDFYGNETNNFELKSSKPKRNMKSHITPYGFARKIKKIDYEYVENFPVYCVTVEKEHTLVANGIASFNCVSFGMKNAIEYLQAVEIFLKGDEEEWHPVFPPYLYGTGRVFSGGGRLPCFSDGSLGAWMADAVIKYGVLFSDMPNVPAYSGSVAKKWGCRPGPPEDFVSIGKQHLVKSAASINTWDELKAAIINGYPVTVASNQGFRMKPSSDGYHRASGSWGHQMCIIGVGTYKGEDYCIILNSWGDAMGELRDFDDPNIVLPIGCIRARRSEIENSMIRNGEVFAISSLDGIKKRKLDRNLFKPF